MFQVDYKGGVPRISDASKLGMIMTAKPRGPFSLTRYFRTFRTEHGG
jgi:hypothetical protein